jgi:crotonobetainyl-CoA:carnitine CoA-transferase CaiB-like acyl-CoA transferase
LVIGKCPLIDINSIDTFVTRHPNIVPYELLEAKDGQIVVAIGNDSQFQTFVKILYSNESSQILQEILNKEEFKTNKARVGNRALLLQYLQPQLMKQTAEYWETQFLKANVPCSRVNNIQQAFSDEQVSARNMIWNLQHEQSGTNQAFVGSPIHFSSVPHEEMQKASKFPPDLGQHTEQVLTSVLQATPQQIKEWKEAGTFGNR